MKYIKSIAAILLLLYSLTGCSYVSDYVEGRITTRASFSINAEYDGTDVVLSWDETDWSGDFAGIEIYRSSYANDEYAPYEMIAYRWDNGSGNYELLNNPSVKQYTDNLTPRPVTGVYFYRVGFVHWDDSLEDRTAGNGYSGSNPDYTQTTYHSKTSIRKVSGYAKVIIP